MEHKEKMKELNKLNTEVNEILKHVNTDNINKLLGDCNNLLATNPVFKAISKKSIKGPIKK